AVAGDDRDRVGVGHSQVSGGSSDPPQYSRSAGSQDPAYMCQGRGKSLRAGSFGRPVAWRAARRIASAITSAASAPITPASPAAGRACVASVKIKSPSTGVWIGAIARAKPSCAISETLVASVLVNVALVAITPRVVLPVPPKFTAPARSSFRASANPFPSWARTPATTSPVAGSITSPKALTTTSAATVRPFGKVIEALPTPDFNARPSPAALPIVAPAPAPTLPSTTGAFVALFAA